jgi:N-acyl-phosphatidylethanolamine-hydrolysing phospholipase D
MARNRHYQAQQPHHRPDGFQNPDLPFQPKSLAEVLRWRWNAARQGLPPAPEAEIPTVAPDLAFLHANASAGAAMQPAVTWIGHATVLVQSAGLNLLTDPIFSQRASPFSFLGPRRRQAPGVALADLPRIDAVLVSHNHYDHLDEASVRALARQPGGSPQFIVPLGLGDWFVRRGLQRVVELDWWHSHGLTPGHKGAPTEVSLVPAQHWSARGLGDRMDTLWGGFAVFAPDCHWFYAGDTAYSREFGRMRERFAPRQQAQLGGGFDVALLPLGAYEPRWFMATQHVNVAEALRIHQDLGAKRSLGVHWGTFELTDEALDEPPRALLRERHALGLSDEDFFVMPIGQTRHLPPRTALPAHD